jgi:dUTP pyrophosphatase
MNNSINVIFKKLSDRISILPSYATDGSAGVDLAACIDSVITIAPNDWVRIPTGLAMQIPVNFVGLVFPRSGLAYRHGVTLQNAVGVIDSDYRGQIEVLIRNEGKDIIEIKDGERIAQLVFMPILKANIEFTDELDNTARGAGGFGSTGK